MQITEQFVLSIDLDMPTVLTVPHDGFWFPEIVGFAEGSGLGGEACVAAIAAAVNFESPAASMVRGLMPRRLCNYNATRESAGVDARATYFHDAYHRTIEVLLAEQLSKKGAAWAIDLHGFNASKIYHDYDLVLGSVSGKTTPRGTDRLAELFFSKAGYRVKCAAEGEKFPGGYTVRRHGGGLVDALQIEISSRLRSRDDPSLWIQFAAHLRAFVGELQ